MALPSKLHASFFSVLQSLNALCISFVILCVIIKSNNLSLWMNKWLMQNLRDDLDVPSWPDPLFYSCYPTDALHIYPSNDVCTKQYNFIFYSQKLREFCTNMTLYAWIWPWMKYQTDAFTLVSQTRDRKDRPISRFSLKLIQVLYS